MVSAFREALEFFDDVGIYDVILPFLLVFTIVFAILEKTKVFGTDEIDGKKYSKKNLNAMTAFVIGFLVVASSKLVETITEVSSNVVVLLLLAVFFLLLVGSFFKEGDPTHLEGGWKTTFMIVMFLGVAGIFLHAIENDDGEPWLEWGYDKVVDEWDSRAVASILLIVIVLGFMFYVVKGESNGKKDKKEHKEDD